MNSVFHACFSRPHMYGRKILNNSITATMQSFLIDATNLLDYQNSYKLTGGCNREEEFFFLFFPNFLRGEKKKRNLVEIRLVNKKYVACKQNI